MNRPEMARDLIEERSRLIWALKHAEAILDRILPVHGDPELDRRWQQIRSVADQYRRTEVEEIFEDVRKYQ